MNKKTTTNRKQGIDFDFKKGESTHSKGGFQYRWTDEEGKRHAMRIKIKLVATLCGEVVDIGDSFHGYELESLDY